MIFLANRVKLKSDLNQSLGGIGSYKIPIWKLLSEVDSLNYYNLVPDLCVED
jgi:hypothetical protein